MTDQEKDLVKLVGGKKGPKVKRNLTQRVLVFQIKRSEPIICDTNNQFKEL